MEWAPLRIGWFTQTRRIEVASMRYRCWHMAWALQRLGFESRIYTKAAALEAELPELDAVVVVKRLDEPAERIVGAVKAAGKPVFLDLCDDLMSAEYKSEKRELHRSVFKVIGPQLDVLTTTTPSMAKRLRNYEGALCPIAVIPDMAETRQVLAAVLSYAHGLPAAAPAPTRARPLRSAARGGPRRVLWFGNHGAPHSNFGILSLIPATVALRAAHVRMALELVVLSNHREKFEVVVSELGVPCRYVEWAPEAAYDELEAADMVLLTNGDDGFSEVKSPNRALQALATGTPVAATSSPALLELGDCVVLDDLGAGLQRYLTDPESAAKDVEKGRSLIARRYAPAVVAQAWAELLRGSGPARAPLAPQIAASSEPIRVLILIEAPEDLAPAAARIAEAREHQAKPMVMLTPALRGRARPVIDFLIDQRIIPTMASSEDLQTGDARWLRAADLLAAGRRDGVLSPACAALARLAEVNGVGRISLDEDLGPLSVRRP